LPIGPINIVEIDFERNGSVANSKVCDSERAFGNYFSLVKGVEVEIGDDKAVG